MISEPNENEFNSTQTSESPEKTEDSNKTFLEVPLESNELNSTSDQNSDLNSSYGEERDDLTPFKRNTSLTQSQRKKISPRMTIHQILNSSDDLSPATHPNIDTPSGHPLDNSQMIDNSETVPNEANDNNANNLSVNDSNESKG